MKLLALCVLVTLSADPSGHGLCEAAANKLASQRPIQKELHAAAMQAKTRDNRVIITMGNAHAMIAYLPTMLYSMRFADPDMTRHFVVVVPNRKAWEICSRVHNLCVLDDASTSRDGLEIASGEGGQVKQVFQSAAYMAMMWRKPELVRDLVHSGLHVICMDMDVVALRNFLQDGVLDYASNMDMLVHKEWDDNRTTINAGFYYIRASNASKKFLDKWVARDLKWKADDQQALNEILKLHSHELGMTWKFIPVTTGFNMCVLRIGPPWFTAINAIQKLLQDRTFADSMAFMHCACWNNKNLYSKEMVMQAMVYHHSVFKLLPSPAQTSR